MMKVRQDINKFKLQKGREVYEVIPTNIKTGHTPAHTGVYYTGKNPDKGREWYDTNIKGYSHKLIKVGLNK